MSVDEGFPARRKISDLGRCFLNKFVAYVLGAQTVRDSILGVSAIEGAHKRYSRPRIYKPVDLSIDDERWSYVGLGCVAPLHDSPTVDDTLDAVLCTQVLEYLQSALESVEESCRVLKTGVKLYLTAPPAHVGHQAPYYSFRYTPLGYRSILTEVELK